MHLDFVSSSPVPKETEMSCLQFFAESCSGIWGYETSAACVQATDAYSPLVIDIFWVAQIVCVRCEVLEFVKGGDIVT